MTRAEALRLLESKWWVGKSHDEIASFQLREPRLCCPWTVFHEAVEKAVGRPVYTHEFVDPKSLMAEIRGEVPARTLDDILALLPADRTIVITTEPKP